MVDSSVNRLHFSNQDSRHRTWVPRFDRRAYNARMRDEATYICDSCGEEIVVPVDPSGGESQEYVEDCPVCCCPNVIHVEIDDDGSARVWAEAE